jgi:hypothetical protein
MSSNVQLSKLQFDIGYEFANIDYLLLALTAADAVADIYDGNRGLAQLGDSMIPSALVDKMFAERASRCKCSINKKH